MSGTTMKDQVAIVTGGAQGIGFAVAEKLTAMGARTALWDMDADLARDSAEKLGGIAVKVDITSLSEVEAALAQTETSLGPVSIAVNSAGIAGPAVPTIEYTEADWKRVMDINVNGTFFVNRVLVPGMIERNYGRIANIASIAGKEGNPNASAYSASKAAVIGLTKSLGKELAAYDIAVNCITPAAARTRIFDQITEEHINYMLSKIPRGRFVTVEEAAAMIGWMVSPENSFTTGAVFDLSGGRATY
ncbi:MAG: SDR family NAD(P)-dependent oxidoreductase [Pseudomonadota bacterium]